MTNKNESIIANSICRIGSQSSVHHGFISVARFKIEYDEDALGWDKREYPEIEIISDQKRRRHETVDRPHAEDRNC